MKGKWSAISRCGGLLAVAMVFLLPAQAEQVQQLVGTVREVSSGGRRFVMSVPGGETHAITLLPGATVVLGGQPGTPDDLGPGANVRVEGTPSGQALRAFAVRILGPHFEEQWQPYPVEITPTGRGRLLLGTITEVNAAVHKLQVLTTSGRVTVRVPSNVPVLAGNTPAGLEALARGDRVRILLDRAQDWTRTLPDRQATAQEVRLVGPRSPVTPLPYPADTFEGVVTSVFDQEQVLVVRASRGSYAVQTAEAGLHYGAAPVTFRRFSPGDLVRVLPEPVGYPYYGEPPHRTGFTTVRAQRVELVVPANAESTILRGVVAELDREKGRFTLNGTPVVTSEETTYAHSGQRISLADLRNGQSVEVVGTAKDTAVEAKRIQVLADQQGLAAIAGEVAGWDPKAGTFRLGETAVATQAATLVVWPGGPFHLSDLRNGDRVEVVGQRRGETVFAERVEVATSPRHRPAVEQRGRAASVDERHRVVILGTQKQRVYIPPRAPIVRGTDTLEMAELRAGNDLQVRGYLIGNTLVAVSVRRWD